MHKTIHNAQNLFHYFYFLLCTCVFVEELHAEACYAECLLQRAALTFLQVGISGSNLPVHTHTHTEFY